MTKIIAESPNLLTFSGISVLDCDTLSLCVGEIDGEKHLFIHAISSEQVIRFALDPRDTRRLTNFANVGMARVEMRNENP